jgi:hemoglobin/transferrin/lactoferrin receptor protein
MGLVAKNTAALLGSVAVMVLVSSGAGYAQTTTATPVATTKAAKKNASNVTLLERLVIGAGSPKIAVDTPQAVTVVDQADIDAKQANTIGEIFDDMPGVTMVGSERVLGETFNIRGIGSSDSPTSSGDGSKIIINVDGAQKFYEQYRMGSFFSDPELYKRVEVLRGPASATLYGSGALGGVVNFTTKDAEDFIKEGYTGALKVKGQYISNGNGLLTSAVLAHHINDTFDILATGNFRRSDAQQLANGTTLSGSNFTSWSGLVKGTARFGDADEQILRLSYQRWMSGADRIEYNQTGTIPSAFGGFGLADRDVTDNTAVLSYENPASDNPLLDLKASLSFADTLVQQRNTTGLGVIGDADYGYKNYQANVENTSEFEGEGWTNYLTYGVQLNHQDRVGTPVGGGIISTHPAGRQTKLGVFAQDEQTWNDRISLTGGLRADFVNLTPDPLVLGGKITNDIAISPKVAALYKLTDNFNVFTSLAHTERVPSLDEIFQYGLHTVTGAVVRTPSLQLTKERSDNFEIGFSGQGYDVAGLENTVGFKTTAFYNDIKDGIRSNPNYVSQSATPGLPYFVNVANMRIWGFELEGSYESEVAFARLAYTLTRGEFGSRVSATIPAGTPLDTIAQDKMVLTVGGRVPDWAFEYGVKLTAAADPITAVVAYTPSPSPAKAWQTVDLFASWKPQDGAFEGTEAQFAVENVFNADYRENLNMDRSKGRTFKLTLAKQFDY